MLRPEARGLEVVGNGRGGGKKITWEDVSWAVPSCLAMHVK